MMRIEQILQREGLTLNETHHEAPGYWSGSVIDKDGQLRYRQVWENDRAAMDYIRSKPDLDENAMEHAFAEGLVEVPTNVTQAAADRVSSDLYETMYYDEEANPELLDEWIETYHRYGDWRPLFLAPHPRARGRHKRREAQQRFAALLDMIQQAMELDPTYKPQLKLRKPRHRPKKDRWRRPMTQQEWNALDFSQQLEEIRMTPAVSRMVEVASKAAARIIVTDVWSKDPYEILQIEAERRAQFYVEDLSAREQYEMADKKMPTFSEYMEDAEPRKANAVLKKILSEVLGYPERRPAGYWIGVS